ncbi:MAG: hypothetical protein P8Q37_02130 [Porticoccaceae bacterium]|nr:hypothetical protein [Porticoccaceae bacterium]
MSRTVGNTDELGLTLRKRKIDGQKPDRIVLMTERDPIKKIQERTQALGE